jgi:uncharacterized membrane protein YidH (DUF202 family)
MPITRKSKNDFLAEERTILAEERTFLSSIRTVATLIGLFIVIIKLFVAIEIWANIALVVLLVIGFAAILEEVHLYHKKKKEIIKIERMRVK